MNKETESKKSKTGTTVKKPKKITNVKTQKSKSTAPKLAKKTQKPKTPISKTKKVSEVKAVKSTHKVTIKSKETPKEKPKATKNSVVKAPMKKKKVQSKTKHKKLFERKVKRLKDPGKVRKIKKISFETLFITTIVFFAMFTNKIPYFKDSEFASVIDKTLGKFFDISSIIIDNYLKIFETLTILIFVWVLNKIGTLLMKLIFGKRKKNSSKVVLFNSFFKYFMGFFGLFFILSAWGVETSTILASMGILGLAISFGAQSLVEDIISGMFLILENQFKVGDIVYIDDFRGIVHEMGLRTTKFIDQFSLDVKIMKNSSVKNIINASLKLSVAVCDVGITYSTDLKKVERIVKPFLLSLVDKYPDYLYNSPLYLGVQELGDSSVVLRFAGKTTESKKFQLERILNKEIKLLFDKNKIEIPFPQVDIHSK